MNILTFILFAWLLVVAIAWCIDNGTEILAERRLSKEREKEAEDERAAKALQMLTMAGLHKNAAVTYTRKPGNHRFTRI